MTILFGHPTGNPNSHHAALAHFEADRLEAFCVPWMPSRATLDLCARIEPLKGMAKRLARRRFPPLASAPKIQGRLGELRRLLIRALGCGNEGLSYEADDWLMRIMARECHRSAVRAVHAYEDCSLTQFEEAKRLGKACIYDMPIGYYPAWQNLEAQLAREHADWLPAGGLPSSRYVRPEQKRQEMELADLVLAPNRFVEKTIRDFHPAERIELAPYGVDCEFWTPATTKEESDTLRFLYAGQLSLRKGIPHLLKAWDKAAVPGTTLNLVGRWQLADEKRKSLPAGVSWAAAVDRATLRALYRQADVFVFPSFFEGLPLVMLEAMACGLPVVASTAAGEDLVTEGCGRLVPAGNIEALVESLRWFSRSRDSLRAMGFAARAAAERCSWERYRRCVKDAVTPFV
jgi:glycosyltransferase involved in cell wall biosynthesis